MTTLTLPPNACGDAVRYVARLDGDIARAWRECPRGDWLLWLAAHVGVDRRAVVGAASACARLALPIWTARHPNDTRVAECLDACDRYARGEDADLVSYRRAAAAAAAAYADAAAYAAAYAYAAAAYADAAAAYAAAAYADAAYAAAYAAAAAAYAADAYAADAYAADADAADAAAAARSRTLVECADIVRARISWETIEALLPRAAQ